MRRFWLGLIVLALSIGPAFGQRAAPSFDCSKTQQADEAAVCNDTRLSELDRIANLAFAEAQTNRAQRTVLPSLARDFLKERKNCEREIECIERSYVDFIKLLQDRGATVKLPPWFAVEQYTRSLTLPEPRDELKNAPIPPPLSATDSPQKSEPQSSEASAATGGIVLLAIIIIFGLFIYTAIVAPIRRSIRTEQVIDNYVKTHASLFSRRKSQLVYFDEYGIVNTRKWDKEKRYIATVVIPQHLQEHNVNGNALRRSVQAQNKLLQKIEAAASSVAPTPNQDERPSRNNGLDYERQCAEILRNSGWTARLTAGSGDQGVDIVAEGFGKRLVLQCKYYSSPVGNKAVQEAIGAREFEQADAAIVVSNATYTPSARRLANTAKVLLLHHDDLKALRAKLNS